MLNKNIIFMRFYEDYLLAASLAASSKKLLPSPSVIAFYSSAANNRLVRSVGLKAASRFAPPSLLIVVIYVIYGVAKTVGACRRTPELI